MPYSIVATCLLSMVCFLPTPAIGQEDNRENAQPKLPPQQDLQWQGSQAVPSSQTVAGPSRAVPIPNARPLNHSRLPAQHFKTASGTQQQQPPRPQQGDPSANPKVTAIPVALRDASFGLNSNSGPVIRTNLIIPNAETASSEANAQQEASPARGSAANPANSNQEVVDASITTVTRGMQQLPNEAGQVWRTYDITPYTYSIESTDQSKKRPEQAIVDWILKETGTEVWFSQPMGVLSADRNKLHVYQTPAMQARIKPIIDRFVQGRGKTQVVGLKLMTIASPNWRATAFPLMQPIPVTSTGVEAWLMSKENAAILSNQLRMRADYQEQSAGDLVISDGQRYNLAKKRPIQFLRSIQLVNQNGFSQYQPINSQIDEGYSIDFSGLSSLDGRSFEAIIGCDINQIEKMQRVTIDLPTASGQTQPVDLQIPQMVSWNVRERFRWPADQVLVLSCGVVATPGPQRQALLGLPSLLNGTRGREDALMFVEYKGLAPKMTTSTAAPVNGQGAAGIPGTGGWNGRPAVGQNGMIPVSPRR